MAKPREPVEAGLERLSQLLDGAAEHQVSDPETFLWYARRALEMVCLLLREVCVPAADVGQKGRESADSLHALIEELSARGHIDAQVRAGFEVIRQHANLGVHVRSPVRRDLGRAVKDCAHHLPLVVGWLVEESPAKDALGESRFATVVQGILPTLVDISNGRRTAPHAVLEQRRLQDELERAIQALDELLTQANAQRALLQRHGLGEGALPPLTAPQQQQEELRREAEALQDALRLVEADAVSAEAEAAALRDERDGLRAALNAAAGQAEAAARAVAAEAEAAALRDERDRLRTALSDLHATSAAAASAAAARAQQAQAQADAANRVAAAQAEQAQARADAAAVARARAEALLDEAQKRHDELGLRTAELLARNQDLARALARAGRWRLVRRAAMGLALAVGALGAIVGLGDGLLAWLQANGGALHADIGSAKSTTTPAAAPTAPVVRDEAPLAPPSDVAPYIEASFVGEAAAAPAPLACPPEMAPAPASTFTIGQPSQGQRKWTPAKTEGALLVTVAAFCIDREPVSLDALREVGAYPVRGCEPQNASGDGARGVCQTRDQAAAFCAARTSGGRLPKIAEWEAVARLPNWSGVAVVEGTAWKEWVDDHEPLDVFDRDSACAAHPCAGGMTRATLREEGLPSDGNVLNSWQHWNAAVGVEVGFRCAWAG